MRFVRLGGVILFAYLAYLLYEKGVELKAMGTNADGDGIGISFLGLQVAERVPEENIPQHAKGFFVTSVIFVVIGLTLLFQPLIKKAIPSKISNWFQRQLEIE
ncbi:hypothetical protein ACFS6F_05435 [Halobacillus naozhouensis]